MTPEAVLALKPNVLSRKQREFYFENGYLFLERIIPAETIEELRRVTEAKVEETRALAKSDAVWDLEAGHSAAQPRLRRLSSPCDHHPAYWSYASRALLVEIVADLVGPDVKFHHSKLNFKSSDGGAEVKWHQDIQFWPHTNYSPLTVGTYLYDCGEEQGPLGVIPESHKGPLFDQFNDKGQWVGCISDKDLARADVAKAAYLEGPAGSLTLHNCRTIHGSKPNNSSDGRPLFLATYSSADAIPYSFNPLQSRYREQIVRGKPARWAHHDPRPCLLPPDWSGGYSSIFALQQEENGGAGEPIRAYAG
jgi:ectoine hydroxylase